MSTTPASNRTTHTPGPWTIKHAEFITYIKADTGHKEIAVMYADSGVNKRANAHLIAAAPELHEAAQLAVNALSDIEALGGFARSVDPKRWAEQCAAPLKAALAKASGSLR